VSRSADHDVTVGSTLRLVFGSGLVVLLLAVVGQPLAATEAAGGPTPVAAFSFNEGAGTSVADASGTGNTGSLQGASWTTQGKYGNALSFNGAALVNVPDAPSLRLTGAMTLEAWVYPTSASSSWNDAIYKGNDNYYLMASSFSLGQPAAGGIFAGSHGEVFAPNALPLNTWTHLAATYDGTTLRLYLNGTLADSKAQTGTLATSSNPLTIGGDPIFGQYFQGRIDEIRIYNTALTQPQLQTDMTTPIT
jgi:hypothetical protein